MAGCGVEGWFAGLVGCVRYVGVVGFVGLYVGM